MQATVLGAGSIGSTIAYDLATGTLNVDVNLVDIDEAKARGHAIDATHATAHSSHPVGRTGDDTDDGGSVTAKPPGPEALAGADCIVMAASAPRPEDAEDRGSRVKWLEGNLDVVADVSGWMRDVDPKPILVVTNPMDVITHRLYQQSGWPRECFLGYSLSETARLADHLARAFETTHRAVSCPVLGEHGENMVPLFSRASVDGEPVDLSAEEKQNALDYTRSIPFDVISMRGSSESSRWVTGRGAAQIVRTILDGGPDEPVDLATPLEGEYGYEDVCLSVPVRFDETGVTEILEWELSEWERDRLEEAYRSVRADLSTVE